MERTEEHTRRRSIDRLSDLPDAILCHILSFLPTQKSISTSVLARRWRYLWAYVPTLDFRHENQEIIERVMILHKVQTISTFRLFHYSDCSNYRLETWITFAIARNVQKLQLLFHLTKSALPRCLFTCKTLVDLRLNYFGIIPMSCPVCLPRLKILHLICVQYEADEALPRLLASCPVLEELEIESCMDSFSSKISSPTIKRLTLSFPAPDRSNNCYTLEINTPALVYLRLVAGVHDHIKSGALTSLTEADIHFYKVHKQRGFVRFRYVPEFINRLCSVKFLKLNLAYYKKTVDSKFSLWTTSNFRNLTKLELTAHCSFLSEFLANADNLEILIFQEFYKEGGWIEPPQRMATCILSHLRVIKLVNIKGKTHDFEIIRYLLKNAKLLERIEISHPVYRDTKKKARLVGRIGLFERGSKAYEIAFVPINCDGAASSQILKYRRLN
ncbi:hypothetical protein ABFX02_13G077500 [Erythranthe guttata]